MPRLRSPVRLACVLSIALGATAAKVDSASADADDKAKSIALFKKGRTLMERNDYAGACEAFEASAALDPAPGTTLNLGVCHEQLKKWAAAWGEYTVAENQAKAAKRDDRLQIAQEGLARLRNELTFITITVDGSNGPVEVAVDGKGLEGALLGTEFPIDPGSHLVTARSDGKKDWSFGFVVDEVAKHETITVPKLDDIAPPTPVKESTTHHATPVASVTTMVMAPKQPPVADSSPRSAKSADHTLAWVSIAVGGAFIAGGTFAHFEMEHALTTLKEDCATHVMCDDAKVRRWEAGRWIGWGVGLVGVGFGVWDLTSGAGEETTGKVELRVGPASVALGGAF